VAVADSIQRYPLLRLLVAYLLGIGIAHVVYPLVDCKLLAFVSMLIALSMLVILAVCVVRSKGTQVVFGVWASLFFVSIGMIGYIHERHVSAFEWPPTKMIYEARVLDMPRNRERSVLCEVNVEAVCDSAVWQRVHRKVYAYMSPSDSTDVLKPGDMILFNASVRPPRNFSDDLTFDYAAYLSMQGVAGTVYLPKGTWVKTGTSHTMRGRLLSLRQRLIQQHMYPMFDSETLGVLAAFTLGEKRMLTDEVRAAYIDAGAAHALALSGLHVGVIYAMLAFLLRSMVRRRGLRWVSDVLVVVILWLFALMVGMSSSVVRAVAMCTLYVMARWISRDSASIHVLSLAALVMLLVHPLYLFDVSFQLSFMAMASILWLEPYMETFIIRTRASRFVSYITGVLCMSLAAQVGTLPLSLYHFGTFPTYFLLTNVLVVPCLSVLLLLSFVWWLLVLMGCSWATLLGSLLQYLTTALNSVLTHISHWPYAVLHVERFGALSVLFSYMLIFSLGLFYTKRWPKGFVYALASLLGLLLSLL
jgi:competence protein ComEC